MQSFLSFLLSNLRFSLLENHIISQVTLIVWLSIRLVFRIINKLTQLALTAKAWLIELSAYQIPSINKYNIIIFQQWNVNDSLLLLLYNGNNAIPSIEKIRRNARWLERETAEMYDLTFANKQDRRALFLTPILYWGVLKNDFPVGGFFDANLSLQLGRIVICHSNWGG